MEFKIKFVLIHARVGGWVGVGYRDYITNLAGEPVACNSANLVTELSLLGWKSRSKTAKKNYLK